MANNPTRFQIIPLNETNEALATDGEIVALDNAEVIVKKGTKLVNPFDKFRTTLNNLFLDLSYYVWHDGGAKYGQVEAASSVYPAQSLGGSTELSTTDYTGFAFPAEEVTGSIGDFWFENGVKSFQIKETGTAPAGSFFDWIYFIHSKMPAYNESTFPLKIGTGTFKGATTETAGANVITIPTQADSNYKIFITPNADTSGNLGDLFVTKTTTSFTVKNTGSDNASTFNYLLIGNSIADLYDKFTFPIVGGTANFNGSNPREITFSSALGNNRYVVLVQPLDDSAGAHGQIIATDKTTTGFKVTNTGKVVTSRFDWVVFQASEL